MACTPAVYSGACFFVVAPSPPPPPPPPPPPSASTSPGRRRTATKIHAMRRQGAVMTASVGACGGPAPAIKRTKIVSRSMLPIISVPPGEAPESLVHAEDAVGGQALHARLAAQGHVPPQLVAQDVERVVHALGAADGQAPERGASDGHHARPPREPLEHGGAAAEAAVDDEVGTVPDGVGDGGQRVDGRLGAVELAAAMIGDPDDLHAHVDGALGVARGHDPLEADREA